MRRLADQTGHPSPDAFDETVDVLHTLTGFHTYDNLAGSTRSPDEVAAIIVRLAQTAFCSAPD